MNVDEIRAELEANLTRRLDEIRFLKNQCAALPDEPSENMFRRSIVLVLYAHFEGFCKFALNVYITAINNEGLTCREVSYGLAAASVSDLFEALRDPLRRCSEFRNTLPDDSSLHRFARDREFLERANDVEQRIVNIPERVVDTESNLTPVVLKKLLYRIGLPHGLFEHLQSEVNLLLRYRNEIAHGVFLRGVTLDKYNRFEQAANAVTNGVLREITAALVLQRFLRRFA